MKNILVTGGAGYVGAVLVPKLLYAGYNVTVLDLMIYGNPFGYLKGEKVGTSLNVVKGDIRDFDLIEQLMKGIDCVIHLACISNDPSCDLNPELGESINLDSFEPLVDMAREAQAKRFINASSSSVYGVKDVDNVTEDMALEPLTAYSRHKAQTEDILKNYHDDKFTTVSVRSATVCGYSRRQRLDVVVNILANWAYHKRKISVHGGPQKRPNIHIDDITDLYAHLINVPSKLINGDVFNYGHKNHTIDEIAQMVKKNVGQDVEITHQETNDLRSYHISSDKIFRRLGVMPEKSLDSAILDLVFAFKSGRLTNTFDDDYFYNVKRMANLNLE